MKPSAKLLALVAFFIIALPVAVASDRLMAPTLPTQEPGEAFRDVYENHPFATAVADMKVKGVVKGYPDGTFAPDNSISRGEFVTMLMRSIAPNAKGGNCFTDVKNEWFAPSVCTAKQQGILKGYDDGSFGTAKNINAVEASQMLAVAYKLKLQAASSRDPWFKPAVSTLAAAKAIPTSIDYPEEKLSRAETVEIIDRLVDKDTSRASKTYSTLTASLPTFTSCMELEEKAKIMTYQQGRQVYFSKDAMLLRTTGPVPMQAQAEESSDDSVSNSPAAPGSTVGTDGDASRDYSNTNVQVEGVDEADVVKNDGDFIYLISGRTIRIVRAYPPEQMGQVAKLELSDKNFTPSDIYVAGNKLVVLGSTYEEITPQPLTKTEEGAEPKMIAPNIWPVQRSRAVLYVLDMSDKANLRQERSVEFDGYTVSSRRIGEQVYLVVNNNPDYYRILEQDQPIEDALPRYNDSRIGQDRLIAPCSRIHFLPRYNEMNMLTVASINITDPSAAIKKEVIMGSGSTIYASTESLYIASQYYPQPEVGILDVWAQVFTQGPKTNVFRFSLNNGDVKFVTKGDVPGSLLNQFSMDESGDAFRLATTTGEVWRSENPSRNNLYILDRNNLTTTLGKIENIAPGEQIYSVRFMGKRAYMVTFKKIDPFFVIDVEDPRNPRILGELKIPGYSNYLHPYDENHVIGFGKDAVDPKDLATNGFTGNRFFDFAWYQGMKIALFDVTDVANPKVLFSEMIGDRGTESEVLHNHKALLYDKARNLFAFPVTVHEVQDKTLEPGQDPGAIYGTPVYQGAYVYTLDLEKGFQLKGKITHHEGDDNAFVKQNTYTWYQQNKNTIHRIVSIGDYLYTISLGKIKAISRESMEQKNATELQVDEQNEPVYWLE